MLTVGRTPANEERTTVSAPVRDVLANLFHDRVAIAATFLVIFGLAVATTLGMSREYETEARLLVLPGQEYTSQPLNLGGFSAGNLVADQISKAEIEVLSSNELRREVVRRVGAAAIDPTHSQGRDSDIPGSSPDDRAARRLGDDLVIEPQQDSSVVRIRYRNQDPVLAARVVNELLEAYLGARLGIFSRDRSAFLVPRRDEADANLARARAALIAFNAANGVSSVPAEVVLRLEQQSRLALQALQARQVAASAAAQAEALQRSLDTMPAQVLLATDRGQEAESGNSRATLLSLQLRRQELLSKYADTSAFIQDLDQQIAALRGFEGRNAMRSSTATNMGPNPAVDALRVERDAASANADGQRARAEEVERQIAAITRRLTELGTMRPEQQQLEHDVELAELRSRILLRRFEDALAGEAFDKRRVGNVRVTQLASPGRPTSSGRLLVLGAGLLLGLLAAATMALARALLRETMLTPTGAAQRMGLPVLVTVSEQA